VCCGESLTSPSTTEVRVKRRIPSFLLLELAVLRFPLLLGTDSSKQAYDKGPKAAQKGGEASTRAKNSRGKKTAGERGRERREQQKAESRRIRMAAIQRTEGRRQRKEGRVAAEERSKV
jgi:hypothetical protein